jgi:hypothetical protein
MRNSAGRDRADHEWLKADGTAIDIGIRHACHPDAKTYGRFPPVAEIFFIPNS